MEDSTKNVRDPFDPFSDKEEVFETKNIKTSKAGRLKYKTPIPSASTKKKKPLPLSKRLKLALKSFSEREDKKRIFLLFGISLLLIAGITIVYIMVISPWEKETTIIKQMDDVSELIERRDEISEDNFEDRKDSYKEDLLNKLEKTEKGSKEEYLYLSSLAEIYYAENDYQSLTKITERELEYKGLSTAERALKLYNLLLIYDSLNDEKGVRDCLERFYALPDENSTKVFEVNTLTEMKATLRERYPDE